MNTKTDTKKLVRIALLTAVLLVMEITGIGLIKTPSGLEMTVMHVPVIIGAILMGPVEGAILGGVFGCISFWECFGKSAFGSVLLGINPIFTFIVCIPTRILMGFFCGLIFKALGKGEGKGVVSFTVASFSGALLNTFFFMTALIVLFGSTEFIMSMRGDLNLVSFVAMFVGIQGALEAVLAGFLGAALSKILWRLR